MIPRVAMLGTGFVGAGLYYMHDKQDAAAQKGEKRRPSAAEYFLTDKGPAQTADRVGFTETRNLATNDPMTALRQMAFTAAHAHDIRVAAVAASAKAAGMSYDAYVKATNPFRGRRGSKPVYSLSLSFEPGDPDATKENMLKAADEVRHALGLQDHQCVIIQHTDTKHPHIHLIINRVNQHTGKFASVSNDRLVLSKWALDWEQRHGRIVCPERPKNWKKRDRNTETKRQTRVAGNARAKAGYVKSKGLPPSEIDFWNKHGSHDREAVRRARAEYQKRDYENHKSTSRMRLNDVAFVNEVTTQRHIARIDRTLSVLRGEKALKRQVKAASPAGFMFAAVRGAALSAVARLKHRSDIAKLTKLRRALVRDMDIRREKVLAERTAAFEKLKRIHAWQNRLDDRRCANYRDSDTREWRDRRDRWDLGKIKPPLFGSVHLSFYDVDESKSRRQAAEDRRQLGEAAEMKPVADREPVEEVGHKPYAPRDENRHARDVAARAQQKAEQRRSRSRGRSTGRKRKPRPRHG